MLKIKKLKKDEIYIVVDPIGGSSEIFEDAGDLESYLERGDIDGDGDIIYLATPVYEVELQCVPKELKNA